MGAPPASLSAVSPELLRAHSPEGEVGAPIPGGSEHDCKRRAGSALSASPEQRLPCRRFLHLTRSHFNAVLLDKAGTDRERYINPVSPDELFVFIDTYLLSEREAARREQGEDPCE